MRKSIIAVTLFAFFFNSLLSQGKRELDCKYFSVNQGLSQYDVSAIIQDELGYLWLGTYDGLNRFDGAQNTVFRHKSTFLFETIRNNRILALAKDHNKNIWIGTEGGGISVFNLKKGIFFDIQTNEQNEIIRNGVIPALCTLRDGRMFFSSANGDLFFLATKKIDIKRNILQLEVTKLEYDKRQTPVGKYPSSIIEYNSKLLIGCRNRGLFELQKNTKNEKYRTTIIDQNSITTLFLDAEENIWVGSFSGLKLFRYYTNYSRYINLTYRIPKNITSNVVVSSVCEDNQHQKWVGTSSSGLFIIRKANKNVDDYQIENYNIENSTLHSNRISRVFIDKSNIIWIGSHEDGVAFSDLSNKKFNDLILNVNQRHVGNIFVSSIYPDTYDNIWIGTEDKGLFRIDKSTDKIENFSVGFFTDQKQSTITSTLEDKWGNLWFTTWNGCFYISKQDLLSRKTKINNLVYSKLANYLNASFYSIAESKSGDLWLGSDMGLFRVKRSENGSIKNIKLYFSSKQNSNNYQIYAIAAVSNNSLIIGTKGHGAKLITFSETDHKLKVDEFREDHSLTEKKLNNNNVWTVGVIDGKIWIGTDEGVNLLVKKNNVYVVESTRKLNDNIGFCKVVSILVDQKGFIWFGTTIGAVRLNLQSNTPEIFTNADGLKSNVISSIALRKLDDILYFGNIKGVNYSALNDLTTKKMLVEPKITHVRINGNDVLNLQEKTKVNSIFDIPYQKEIDLPYNQNNISLSISTFDFFNPSATDYQYRMVGRDDEWILARNGEKLLVYQSLPPGRYEFQLKSTKTSISSKQNIVSLTFDISTPPWKQWWAIIIYLFILSVILVFLFHFLRWRIQLSNELKMEKYRHQQDKELSELKNKLFVNISHELRTPLSLIISPVKEISKFELDKRLMRLFKIVEYNANRLLLLTNQLLDAEKNDRLILNVEKNDILKHIKLITENFSPLAKEKKISISEFYQRENILCYYDADIIEKIVSNLILNAIKYTDENGSIIVKCQIIESSNEMVSIVVEDNGKGITKDKINNIFSLYYQIEDSNGYGVGLTAVKQMAESHHGSIRVKSEEGLGSIFEVLIPVSKNEYLDDKSELNKIISDTIINENETDTKNKKQFNSLLIVEDNPDLRNYLAENLSRYFEIHTAENGEEGIKKAIQVLPDLIVTDIMMPIMSGIKMVKAAFENESIKHIPIIFLTAKGSLDSQLEGMQTGAIDYIIKPVDIDMLKSKIDNHIRIIRLNREKNRRLYLQANNVSTENTIDADFVNKAQEIILKSISEASFDVSKLAFELSLSKIQLHRRFKSVMDVSPGEFIRLTRLKVAYQHLTAGINNVSEIVLMTGFENHSHFTKIVKQQFGKTPQQIIIESKKQKINQTT